MILTCPRCATRYLTDARQVWATGRTVQCDACGQRWRAAGEGVRPAPEPEPPARVDAPELDDVPPVGPRGPVEGRRPDWHATPPGPTPATGVALGAEPSRPPRGGLTTSFGSRPSTAGRWLAIAFLVLILLAALAMFRDLIVQLLPGLAPVYAALGLLVQPSAVPHG